MKLKLDENFDVRLVPDLLQEGFDADTVNAEGLAGGSDETIYDTRKAIGRTLVTLDLDFSNPLRFPPKGTAGIVVVRLQKPWCRRFGRPFGVSSHNSKQVRSRASCGSSRLAGFANTIPMMGVDSLTLG